MVWFNAETETELEENSTKGKVLNHPPTFFPPPPQFYYFLNPEFMTCADTHKTQASQMDIDQREKPWGKMCVSLTQNHSISSKTETKQYLL